MKIDKNHIKDAEKILIDGDSFDDERLEFINYLETIDLLAVPGSGKTTALLAKLYCIAKQMPLQNNVGVLVLSHTNQAIDEIEKVLKPICPQLFNYPNFVGTIQSFANKFIANQACYELYGSYIKKNNDEISTNDLLKAFHNISFGSKLNGYIFNQLYSKYSLINLYDLMSYCSLDKTAAQNIIKELKKEKFITNKNHCYYLKVKDIKLNENDKVKNYLSIVNSNALRQVNVNKQSFCLKFNIDFIKQKFVSNSGDLNFNSDSGKELLFYFEGALKKGILRYRDSISISQFYLLKNKNIINVLQNRFKYVFIDEMQDLDKEQIDLIETIFENSTSIIQRIGDKNQSIYSNSSLNDIILWKTRNELDSKKFPKNLSLNNSHRLTPTIGKLVNGFVLERDIGYEVKGISKNHDIKPYLIVYEEKEMFKLKDKYIEIIKKHNLHLDEKNKKRGFHIISWTTDKEESSDKWYLKKIFPEYNKEIKQKKEDFDCLRKYLYLFDTEKKTFESIRKSLLNGIIRVLRFENIYTDTETKIFFRKKDLLNCIKLSGSDFYEEFNQKLFKWCFDIIKGKEIEKVYEDYQKYIEIELVKYIPNFKVDNSRSFIENHFYNISLDLKQKGIEVSTNEIDLKLGSIHSVKGQTHCSTLYIETDYFGSELDKLFHKDTISNPLLFLPQERTGKSLANYKKTLKMMYVGFSRPTHLLCFAVRKDKILNKIDFMSKSGWEVINIC